MTVEAETRRAQCPVCYESIRLASGQLVPHPARRVRFMGMTARECAGTGLKP